MKAIEGSDVSVIIPAYGNCPYLGQVVGSLLEQTVSPVEIIIIQSGPSNSALSLQGLDHRIRVHHFEERLNAGAARNFGLARAGGTWAAFIDADIRPTRNWLAELLKAASRGPRRFVVGSIGYAETGGYWGLCLWTIEFNQFHPDLPLRVLEGGASGNLLVSVEDIDSAGGFPEQMAASEDALLIAALCENGLTGWFCPAARGDHFNISGVRHCCGHLFTYGFWSAVSRKFMPLRGRATIKLWPLAFFLWLLRFSIISCRIFRGGAKRWMKFILLTPGILFGLLIWNAGYFKGIFQNPDDLPIQGPPGRGGAV